MEAHLSSSAQLRDSSKQIVGGSCWRIGSHEDQVCGAPQQRLDLGEISQYLRKLPARLGHMTCSFASEAARPGPARERSADAIVERQLRLLLRAAGKEQELTPRSVEQFGYLCGAPAPATVRSRLGKTIVIGVVSGESAVRSSRTNVDLPVPDIPVIKTCIERGTTPAARRLRGPRPCLCIPARARPCRPAPSIPARSSNGLHAALLSTAPGGQRDHHLIARLDQLVDLRPTVGELVQNASWNRLYPSDPRYTPPTPGIDPLATYSNSGANTAANPLKSPRLNASTPPAHHLHVLVRHRPRSISRAGIGREETSLTRIFRSPSASLRKNCWILGSARHCGDGLGDGSVSAGSGLPTSRPDTARASSPRARTSSALVSS